MTDGILDATGMGSEIKKKKHFKFIQNGKESLSYERLTKWIEVWEIPLDALKGKYK